MRGPLAAILENYDTEWELHVVVWMGAGVAGTARTAFAGTAAQLPLPAHCAPDATVRLRARHVGKATTTLAQGPTREHAAAQSKEGSTLAALSPGRLIRHGPRGSHAWHRELIMMHAHNRTPQTHLTPDRDA